MNDPAFEHNQQILEDLEWAIAANEGEFELHLIQCDLRLQRQRFIEEWKKLTKFNLQELEIIEKDNQLLELIQEHLANISYLDALIISDFKESYPLTELLSNINQSRDELRKTCSFPVIFFMSEHSIQEFIEHAIDLKNWALPTAILKIPSSLIIENLDHLHSDIIHRLEKTTNFIDSWELWGKSVDEEISQTITHISYLSDNETKLLFKDDPKLFAFLGFLTARSQDWLQRDFRGFQHHFLCTGKSLSFEERSSLYKQVLNDYLSAIDLYWEILETYPDSEVDISEIAIVCMHMAWLTSYWGAYSESKNIFHEALQLLKEDGKLNLWANFAIGYCECLRYLKEWSNLKVLAKEVLTIAEKNRDLRPKALARGFLAEVAIQEKDYLEAISWLDKVLTTSSFSTENDRDLELYGILLAIACEYQDNHQKSWNAWRRVLQFSDFYGEQLNFFFELIEQLYQLYFDNQHFVDAYKVKLEWRSLEYQYGKIAFVGAGRLKPVRRLIFDDRKDEFAASGRQGDVQLIMDRLSRPKHKLTILYGQSGVGKSSMIDAGLLPAIRRKKFISNRDLRPILVRNYGDWQGAITDSIPPLIMGVRGDQSSSQPIKKSVAESSELGSPPAPLVEGGGTENLSQQTELSFLGEGALRGSGVSVGDATQQGALPAPLIEGGSELLADLQHIADQDNLVILIFDQFEEFFFTVTDPKEQRQFFEFLRDCLNIPFIKIILSLREDYLHLLLQGTRNLDLGAIDNNLLHRDIIHYIGNFSPEAAKNVIHFVIDGSEVNFSDELIDILVTDLTTELREVRPIELQIVGQQIQRNIRTKEEYLAKGKDEKLPKETLINQYVEVAIQDCGINNDQIAKLILYYLLSENEHKLMKSLEELELDLAPWRQKLKFEKSRIAEILKILVMSGLVTEIFTSELSQYKVAHDYLIRLVRENYKKNIHSLSLELEQEKLRRLQKEQAITLIKKNQRFVSFFVLSLASLGIFVVALLFDINFWKNQLTNGLRQISDYELEGIHLATKASHRLSRYERFLGNSRSILNFFGLERDPLLTPNNYTIYERSLEKMVFLGKNVLGKEIGRNDILAFSANGEMFALSSENSSVSLWNRQGRLLDVLQLSSNKINDIGFSPGSKYLAISQHGENITLWNLEDSTQSSLSVYKNSIEQIDFHPHKELLASLGENGEIKLWDIKNNTSIRISSREKKFSTIKFSPDGKTLATTHQGNIYLWSIEHRRWTIFNAHLGPITSIDFSPNSESIISTSADNSIYLWDLSGQQIKAFEEHKNWGRIVQFNPDGEHILSTSEDGITRLWNITTNSLAIFEEDFGDFTNTQFSPDGQHIISTSSNGKIYLWSLEGTIVSTLSGHSGSIQNLKFSPDGNTLVSTSNDNTIRLWERPRQEQLGANIAILEEHQGSVEDIIFLEDDQVIVSASSDHSIRLSYVDKRPFESRLLESHTSQVLKLAFSDDLQILASAAEDGSLKIWDLAGNVIQTLEHQGRVGILEFSDNSQSIVFGLTNHLRSWNLETSEVRQLSSPEEISKIVYHHNEFKILSSSNDYYLKLSSHDNQKVVYFGSHVEPINYVDFSPSKVLLVSASEDGMIKLWDHAGNNITILQGHTDAIQGIKFSQDDQILASISRDGTTRLWNLAGKELGIFQERISIPEFNKMVFSPDNKLLATPSSDGRITLWNSEGIKLADFQGHTTWIRELHFSSDGKILASASDDKTVKLWQIPDISLEYFGIANSLDEFQYIGCSWIQESTLEIDFEYEKICKE